MLVVPDIVAVVERRMHQTSRIARIGGVIHRARQQCPLGKLLEYQRLEVLAVLELIDQPEIGAVFEIEHLQLRPFPARLVVYQGSIDGRVHPVLEGAMSGSRPMIAWKVVRPMPR